MPDVTEFDWLDPTEVHLVGAAANDFTPLVAKSAFEKKGKQSMSKRKVTAEDVLKAVLEPLEKAVDDAWERYGRSSNPQDAEAIRSAIMRRTMVKMTLAENARYEHPERHRTHMGPGYVQIITNRRALPADSSIHGWPA
jgi:hypothetical protein